MNKGIGWFLFQVYKWIFVFPFFAVSTVIFGSLAIILSYFIPAQMATFCGVIWARIAAWSAFIRLRVQGREHVDPQQSYVIVANHQSAVDIIVLYGWLGIDFRWVMKQEIRKVPFLGYACYRVGHIYIDRQNKAAAIKSLQAAKARIRGGTSVLFFPEGTRTRGSELQAFKKGAFKMAVDLGLPILPVTLSGTGRIMPTKSIRLMPGRVGMRFHPPIATAGLTDDDIESLMQQSFDAINAGLVNEETA